MRNPNFQDSPSELEQKKQQAAAANSNWKKFLNSAPGRFVSGYAEGMSNSFTGPGSITETVPKAIRAGAGVVERNPVLKKATQAAFAQVTNAASGVQDFIEYSSREKVKAEKETQKLIQEKYQDLKKNDPNNPKLELYKALAENPTEVKEPIQSVEDTATALTEFYDNYHQKAAQYLLSKNPDIERKALETGQSIEDTAKAYSKEVSFGQSLFDNFTSFVDKDSMFDIDITDKEQRDYMFYEGDGFVGGIGKSASGAADLGLQLFGDPFWLAGKGVRAARLGLINVTTTQEAEKGVRKLWQQNYFVDGTEAITRYGEDAGKFSAIDDEIIALRQERLGFQTERDLYRAQIDNPAPGQVVNVEANSINIEILDEHLAKLDSQIDSKRLEANALVPKLTKGHDEFHKQLQYMTVDQIAEHQRFERYGAMRTRLAEAYYLAAKNGDKRNLIDLDLIAMGVDGTAAERMRARSASLMTIIEDQKVVLKKFTDDAKIMSGEIDSAAAKKIYDKADDDAFKLYQAYIEENAFLRAAVAQEGQRTINMVGMLDPRGVSRFRTVEKSRANRARTRAELRFDNLSFTNLARSIYIGRPLYGTTERYRPNNMVTIEGIDQADGYDEFIAWLQKAGSNRDAGVLWSAQKVLGKEESERLAQSFLLANTRAAKEEVLREAEQSFLRILFINLKVKLPEGKEGKELLDNFIDSWLSFKDEKTSLLRERAFYVNSEGDNVSMPLLKTELAYSYYMADSTDLAVWAKNNVPQLNAYFAGQKRKLTEKGTLRRMGWDLGSDGLQLLDQMWRFGVLARLGYPVRNVGAEWLKFAVIGGMFKVFGPQYTSGRELPAAVKKSVESWYSNRYAQFERISLSMQVRQDISVKISIKRYPEYVEMNNHLRQGEIMHIIGDMDYNAFVKLAEKVRANPGKINDLPEFFEEAYLEYDKIIVSQEKLLAVMDRWNSLSPEKRSTGTLQMYGYDEFEEAYAGTQGMALRNALSSGPTIELMTSGIVQKAKSKEWMGVQAKIQPDEPEYYPNLSNTIGTDYVNSETAKEIIRVSIADPKILEAAREEAIKKFKTDAALRDEIMATGRYQLYKAEIKEEQKELKGQLKTVQEKTEKLIVLSDDDIDTLNAGRLPEKFGPTSKEYQKAVKDEKKRLTTEFELDPDYLQKVENLASAFGLSEIGAGKLAEEGLVSIRAIRNAYNSGRLNSDELSAILSTGNIESASIDGFGYEMYRFYTLSEIEALAVKRKNGRYFQVPWVEESVDGYVTSGLRFFEDGYYASRVEDLLTENELRVDAVNRLKALRKQVDDPENLSIEELLELGIKVFDERSIEERYFDEVYEVITRYLPSADLRGKILTLKAGETISPERLRFELGRTGEALKPITGDLLISEEKIRALVTKLADNPRQGSVEAQLDSWLLRKKLIPEKRNERVIKNEEELARAEEANKRLGALDEKASAKVLFNKFRQNVFRYIGQIPEDNLVKWPFGATAYNNHIESIVKNWYKSGFEPTQADLYALHTSARARAISESRKYLYSAQRKLTGPGNVPFLAPFYQAAIIGSKNWARVAWNDPSIIARRVWMYNYINEYADYDKRNGNRTLTLRLPGWLINSIEALPGDQSAYKGALNAFPNLKFNINSFNLMFPGMRLGQEGEQTKATVTSIGGSLFEAIVSSIGAGPLVTIGIETLVKMNPSIDQDIYERTGRVVPVRSVLDKISPSENITADPNYYDLLPPVAKRAYALLNGVDSAEYARINMQLFMTYVHRMETGEMERVPLSQIEQQVANETAALITIKGIANLTLPAIPQFEGEVNKMINIYREYQDVHKEKADSEFIEDFPDWYVVSSTMSKNKGGVLSTIDAQKMSEKHSALINEISSLGGEGIEAVGVRFIGMIVNREGQPTEFDPATRVNFIEEEMYGRFDSGKTAVEQSMIQKGNQDYFKQKDFRDEQIKLHGISIGKPKLTSRSTSDPTVVALNVDFENFVNKQYESNPIWWTQEWEPNQQERVQPTAIRAMRLAVSNEAWVADQTDGNWTEQLTIYLDLQKEYSAIYQASSSDREKQEIKGLFQLDIDTLVSRNETFAYFYERFFDGKDGQPYLESIPE